MSSQKTAKSLAQYVSHELRWVGAALFFVCVLMLSLFVLHFMELTTDSLMRLEAETFAKMIKGNPSQELPRRKSLSVYSSWDSIPEQQKSILSEMNLTPNQPGETQLLNAQGGLEYLFVYHWLEDDGFEIFVLSYHPADEVESTVGAMVIHAIGQSIWLTLALFVFLFVVFMRLLHRATDPLKMLSDWSLRLNRSDEFSDPDVAFPINELNVIADQLKSGIERVEAFNRREQEFLRHASHELRTPLAIMQASLDVLNLSVDDGGQASVQRALRASAKMQTITTTLLWLAKESLEQVPMAVVELKELSERVLLDHEHLNENGNIAVMNKTEPQQISIQRDVFEIIVANLVRNAFQHNTSTQAFIELAIKEDHLRIANAIESSVIPFSWCSDESLEKLYDHLQTQAGGFGLGLRLVYRVCKKLGWRCRIERREGSLTVEVYWC